MARLIDGDALIARIKGSQQMTSKMKSIICYIKTMPTIDAVEVVRCKNCVFSKVYQNDSSGVMGRFCEAFTQVRMVSDDDYCSYGERKESE